MEINRTKIEEIFNTWNQKAFNNELPTPHFEIMTTKSLLGQYKRKNIGGETYHIIRISNFYNRSKQEYVNTIVHEMLHYYIRFKNIKDTSSHGRIWKKMAQDLNKRFRTLQIERCGQVQGGMDKNVLERKRMGKSQYLIVGITTSGRYLGGIVPKDKANTLFDRWKKWHIIKEAHLVYAAKTDPLLETLPKARKRASATYIQEKDYMKYVKYPTVTI